VTGCEKFPEGDLVSWAGETWFLNSSRGTAREDLQLDLEREVCRARSSSLHLVPTLAKLEPEGLHLCARFSGKVIGPLLGKLPGRWSSTPTRRRLII
jgi:hypothetical protein